MRRRVFFLALLLAVTLPLLYVLSRPLGAVPPLGVLLDPLDGLYRTARGALPADAAELDLPGFVAPVTVLRDERGVPHIFAANMPDAVRALGYVTAQDRLFQMDFIPRAAAGRLAAALGPSLVETDRFLRETGMDWGARANLERIRREDGVEATLLDAYASGVNAYLAGLDEADLPFEFRLLGYRPDPYSALQTLRVLQYMTYDLTYHTDGVDYAALREALGDAAFARLYPRFNDLTVPIVPDAGGVPTGGAPAPVEPPSAAPVPSGGPVTALEAAFDPLRRLRQGVVEGYLPGKGSNNWVVGPSRSATGAALLAGDPHLALSLPSIWYEVHLVTPEMDVYGVTVPGTPLVVIGYNDAVAWSPTNTGADQIDHFALTVDDTGTRYRVDGAWRDFERVVDTIRVHGGAPVVDTLRYSAFGPVMETDAGPVALRWVAHVPSRTLEALYRMNRASGFSDFEAALRYWDTPMQNIAYADREGNISIRSVGLLPQRGPEAAMSLLVGDRSAAAPGRVAYEELPHSVNPAQGFLTSTNQQPADSTYRHYLGYDFGSIYRPRRIDALLRRQERHDVEDLMRYQADVKAGQHALFVPLLDTLGLPPRADSLRRMLAAWDGVTSVDRPEPLVLAVFMERLEAQAWDEPVFRGRRRPGDHVLYRLLTRAPQDPWLDVRATAGREDAAGLLRGALTATADTLAARYGRDPAAWRWGDHHRIVFRHLTRSEALRPLWRGPVEYPGFDATLSPAGGMTVAHSASWRMVVDFSATPPRAYGVYPGGQSGNPFSPLYDLHLPTYLAFEYYDLYKPPTPDAVDPARVTGRLILR